MGLYYVDQVTKARTVRESGKVFAQVVKARDITQNLAAQYQGLFTH
jgi:beta-glucosidase/6-phospho-beta-glucosidase/beta-galactosidase